jgi:Glycosyl hydrolase family 20, catalytic domain
MNKMKLLLVCVLGALFGVMPVVESVAGTPGNNLIKNGGFSKGLKFWRRQGGGDSNIHIENGQLFFQKNDKAYSALYQDVVILSSGEYSLAVTADSGNSSSQVIVTPFLQGKFHDRQNSYIHLLPKSGTQQLSKLINIGAEVKKVRIRLVGNATGARFMTIALQKTALDKIQKVQVVTAKTKKLKQTTSVITSQVNLIKNGNFTDGRKGWGQQGGGKSDIRIDNGQLFFQKKDKVYSVLAQDIVITSPGVYSIEVMADSRNGSDAHVIVTPFSQGKFHDRQNSYVSILPQNGMQQLVKLINIGSEVSKVRIRLVGNKTGTLFASVSLKKKLSRKINNIPLLTGRPRLDGIIDEAYWKNALEISDFRVLGDSAVKASVETKVFVASGNGYLYVAYVAEEPAMDKAIIVRKNSVVLYGGDDIELFVSPDQEAYYQFLANAEGYTGASQKIKKSRGLRSIWYDDPAEVREFTGAWKAFAHKGNKKYSIEIKIKLSDIYGNKTVKNPSLYMNFTRHRTVVTGAQKYTNWAGLAGNTFHAVKNFPEFKLAWEQTGEAVAQATENRLPIGTITKPLALPTLLIAGKPIKILPGKDLFTLPHKLNFSASAFEIDSGVKKFIARGIAGNRQGRVINVKISKWDERLLQSLVPSGNPRLSSPEAFILNVQSNSVKINARTRDGALRALATLALLGSQAKSSEQLSFPCFTMVDAPYFKVRGWDAGGVRTPPHLKKLVDLYFLLRLNYLEFEVSTYGRHAAFPFASLPNIGKSKYTKQDFSELADYARARGITLVPLFYSWSRAGFIFNKPEYKHLAATANPKNPKNKKWVYNVNSNAFHPETEKLIFKLYDELIETMKLTHLNPGLDEVHFGVIVDDDAPYSKGKTRLDWLNTVIAKTSKHLAAKGVKMWMFADEINPYHSGSVNGICDPVKDAAKLAGIPRNVTMLPWHYKIPDTGRYNSVEFFKKLGFPVVGVACWYRINNVPTFISDLVAFKGDGILGSTWGNPLPQVAPVELFSAISMLSYLAWSPENCDLTDFPFVASSLYQHIAYSYGNEKPHAGNSKSIVLPRSASSQAVVKLKKSIGFPQQLPLNFLKTAFVTSRGVKIVPFCDKGEPVAVVVNGAKNDLLTIPLNQKCHYISLLHAVNKMYDYEGRNLAKKYSKTVIGSYELIYTDGTTVMLPLKLRSEINEWNDGIVAKKCEPGIYGSMAGRLHVNIPLYTWENPFPAKTIKSLVIRSGNHKDIDLYVFGVSVD